VALGSSAVGAGSSRCYSGVCLLAAPLDPTRSSVA
jgi:hypothetical protein